MNNTVVLMNCIKCVDSFAKLDITKEAKKRKCRKNCSKLPKRKIKINAIYIKINVYICKTFSS